MLVRGNGRAAMYVCMHAAFAWAIAAHLRKRGRPFMHSVTCMQPAGTAPAAALKSPPGPIPHALSTPPNAHPHPHRNSLLLNPTTPVPLPSAQDSTRASSTTAMDPASEKHAPLPKASSALHSETEIEVLPGEMDNINASGHVQQLDRNFSLWSITAMAVTSGNTWVALAGSIVCVSLLFLIPLGLARPIRSVSVS